MTQTAPDTGKMTIRELYAFYLQLSLSGEFPSVNDRSGLCRYRGVNGKKCGVGWLIPDDRYADHIEGMGALGESVTSRFQDFLPVGMTVWDAGGVQTAHDVTYQKYRDAWDHAEFVKQLNAVKCFAKMLSEDA